MERAPGNTHAEQARAVYIDPVTAYVTGPEGYLGSVSIVAPADEVMSHHGAEAAAIQTVHSEIGPGSVTVSGELTDHLREAGLAKMGLVQEAEAEVVEMSDEDFQADLETNGLLVEFPGPEADEAGLLTGEGLDTAENDSDTRGELTASVDSPEDGEDSSTGERIVQLASALGEIVLPNIGDNEIDTVGIESANETPREKAMGELLMSATYIQVSMPEETVSTIEYVDEEAEPARFQQVTYGELQDFADKAAMNMLGALAVTSPDETESNTDGTSSLLRFERLTTNDVALMPVAVEGQLDEDQASNTARS
ncbi:MAG TPA: hypothetical protein VGS08_00105 [Candidatus Saccharimonadales bacterium]|nr:hypothetical protein [Candidatus Saccharimonadales bacterium]